MRYIIQDMNHLDCKAGKKYLSNEGLNYLSIFAIFFT